MKIAIVVDSSCGLTKVQVEKLGWFYLPIQITIDDKSYSDGVEVDAKTIWAKQNGAKNVSTSASLPRDIEAIKSQVAEYDKVLIYPISTELSRQYQSLKIMFEDWESENKAYVVESKKISHAIVLDILRFQKAIKDGASFEKAIGIFAKPQDKTLLIPQENEALVRGGRLSPAAASIAKLLKIVPVIEFRDGLLDKYAKGRIFEKTLTKYARELYENNTNAEDKYFLFNNADNVEIQMLVSKILEENNLSRAFVFPLCPTIAIHTGKGAIAFSYLTITKDEIETLKQFGYVFKK
ncbi:DegV family protein [Mycoplasma sp. 3341]|uniref:DegV family protein n=1 Tax=Mycoplasma sp. 3341 TaxID=3447506 RepID=UPI003F65F30C